MRFLQSMQIYLGSIGSRGPYWIAGLLCLGSPAGSKCLSYKLPLDINIRKTFGPALAQVKALTQPGNAAVQQRQAEINSLQTHRKCAPAVTHLVCFPFMPSNPIFYGFRHPSSIIWRTDEFTEKLKQINTADQCFSNAFFFFRTTAFLLLKYFHLIIKHYSKLKILKWHLTIFNRHQAKV